MNLEGTFRPFNETEQLACHNSYPNLSAEWQKVANRGTIYWKKVVILYQ